jgi:chromate reductase
MRDGLAYTGGLVLPLPEVLVPRAFERFDAESNLTDEETRQNVRDLLKAFGAWTRRVLGSADMAAAS